MRPSDKRFNRLDKRCALTSGEGSLIAGRKDSKAYINRGHAYSGKGDIERELRDFNKAARLDPKDADAFNGRGFARPNVG